jgi:hypothetical protein
MMFTRSWVSIEKRVLSNVPRRRGPRESREMAGSVGPKAYKNAQRIYIRGTGSNTIGVLCCANDGDSEKLRERDEAVKRKRWVTALLRA